MHHCPRMHLHCRRIAPPQPVHHWWAASGRRRALVQTRRPDPVVSATVVPQCAVARAPLCTRSKKLSTAPGGNPGGKKRRGAGGALRAELCLAPTLCDAAAQTIRQLGATAAAAGRPAMGRSQSADRRQARLCLLGGRAGHIPVRGRSRGPPRAGGALPGRRALLPASGGIPSRRKGGDLSLHHSGRLALRVRAACERRRAAVPLLKGDSAGGGSEPVSSALPSCAPHICPPHCTPLTRVVAASLRGS